MILFHLLLLKTILKMKIKISKNNSKKINNENIVFKHEKQKTVLIKRDSRLGDIIMSMSLANRFYEDGYKVYFSTRNEYKTLFNYSKNEIIYVDDKNFCIEFYDEFYDINRIHSNNMNTKTKLDMFYAVAGYNPENYTNDEKRPFFQFDRAICIDKYKLGNNINIAISIESYNPKSPRSISIDVFYDLFKIYKDINFIILGRNPISFKNNFNNVSNYTGNTPSLDDFISIVRQCSYIITIDTGLMHLAGAMEKPQLAIFGPTRPEFLASIYTDMIVLDANQKCSPCWEKGCGDICTKKLKKNILESSLADLMNNHTGYKVLDFNGELLKYES